MDAQTLTSLNARIAGCTACRLHETRTLTVPGDGDPDAELMFIGEGPGANEDKQGRPFVGRAGQLLDELLGEIGLSRPEVFVANVVKCRPPGNRDPQPDEIGCCEVYLREQIEGIRPKLIVLLGRFATQYFLPDAKMGESRGQPFQAGPWLILPVYHPSAALRNSNLMQTMRDDFAIIPPLLAYSERPEIAALQVGHSHGDSSSGEPAQDDDSQRSLL
ncbi:MAG: uracil-DNA glycosylase [Chloroflexi bacterium]|nr:uracil-DNA glycosylase [Chloroflexota bacterium]